MHRCAGALRVVQIASEYLAVAAHVFASHEPDSDDFTPTRPGDTAAGDARRRTHCRGTVRRERPRGAVCTRTIPRGAADDSVGVVADPPVGARDRKSTRLNSSHPSISYAVFC